MQIIPAIDIIDGKCVGLTQGDYLKKTVYNEDPLQVAQAFEEAGIRRLHLVDLDGAKAGAVRNWSVLERITSHTSLHVDFGGGIKTEETLTRVFDSGAAFATIGSLAVKDPELFTQWVERFGPDRFLLGADVKNGRIAISGWTETSTLTLFELLDTCKALGITQVFCTDVSKDGLMEGPAFELYQSILENYPSIGLIASGGVRHQDDLHQLSRIGCTAAIVGKAYYEGKITLEELSSIEKQTV